MSTKPDINDIDLDSLNPDPAPADAGKPEDDEGTKDAAGGGNGDDPNKKTDPFDSSGGSENENQTNDLPLVRMIAKNLSVEIGDDVSDDEQGLVQVATTYAEQEAQRRWDEMLSSVPLMKEFSQFVNNGGDPAVFAQVALNRTFEKVEVKQDDTATQKLVVIEFLRSKGYSEDLIVEEVADSEASGTLFKKAEKYHPLLVKAEQESASLLLAEQESIAQEEEKMYQEYVQEAKKTINSSTSFAGLPIPVAEKTAFFEYFTKPVTKEGYTQRDLDVAKLSIEQQLAMNYLLFSKFDIAKVTGKLVKNEQAQTLKDRLEADRKRSAGQSPQAKGGGTVNDISF